MSEKVRKSFKEWIKLAKEAAVAVGLIATAIGTVWVGLHDEKGVSVAAVEAHTKSAVESRMDDISDSLLIMFSEDTRKNIVYAQIAEMNGLQGEAAEAWMNKSIDLMDRAHADDTLWNKVIKPGFFEMYEKIDGMCGFRKWKDEVLYWYDCRGILRPIQFNNPPLNKINHEVEYYRDWRDKIVIIANPRDN